MRDDEDEWANKLADKYVKKIMEEKYATDWKKDYTRYDEDDFDKLFNAYGNSKEDWDKYRQNPISKGYPQGNPYHTKDAEAEFLERYKKLADKMQSAGNVTKADDWEKTPAVDDRWNELKEMLKDFDGTPMEKLAAIEKFVETH